jgi:hypothetical protein
VAINDFDFGPVLELGSRPHVGEERFQVSREPDLALDRFQLRSSKWRSGASARGLMHTFHDKKNAEMAPRRCRSPDKLYIPSYHAPRREVSHLGFKPVAVQWMKAIIHDATSKSSLTTDVCRSAKPWRAWRFNGGILDQVSV